MRPDDGGVDASPPAGDREGPRDRHGRGLPARLDVRPGRGGRRRDLRPARGEHRGLLLLGGEILDLNLDRLIHLGIQTADAGCRRHKAKCGDKAETHGE